MIFQEKYFTSCILLNGQILLSGCLDLGQYLCRNYCTIFGQYVCRTCFPGCDVINFEIKLRFPIKPFSNYYCKLQDKILDISRTKKAFKQEIKSIFHHF